MDFSGGVKVSDTNRFVGPVSVNGHDCVTGTKRQFKWNSGRSQICQYQEINNVNNMYMCMCMCVERKREMRNRALFLQCY